MSLFVCESRCEKLWISDADTQDIGLSTAHSTQVPVFFNIIMKHTNAFVTFWEVLQHEEVEEAISE